MKKTDGRHYNRATNRSLKKEMDLWVAYTDNNKQPILIGVAIAPPSKGYFGDKYELYYSPSDIHKDEPFLIRSEKGITDYFSRCITIREAKYKLKKENPAAKWVKVN